MTTLTLGLDFVLIWTIILGVGVFFYVMLDGFDLGVGILFGLAPDTASRNLAMNSIAPIWDGNETWLVLGSMGLLAAFPIAFAIIMPAVYFPILIMLLSLIFRGVAFEFRYRDSEHRTLWDRGFNYGSVLATFAQGIVLGAFVQGFRTDGIVFTGSSLDCFTPFSAVVGVCLVFGYSLLGAGWLVLKTEGKMQSWARAMGRWAFTGVCGAILVVSIWTSIAFPDIGSRWFSWPGIALLTPVPIITAVVAWLEWRALNRTDFRVRTIHRWPRAICVVISRPRHQPVPVCGTAPADAVAGGIGPFRTGISADRHAVSAAGDLDVHGMVILGVPRQGAGGHRLSLMSAERD